MIIHVHGISPFLDSQIVNQSFFVIQQIQTTWIMHFQNEITQMH